LLATAKLTRAAQKPQVIKETLYTSIMLEHFSDGLTPENQVRLLDPGPVCGRNIEFFARRIKRLYVRDVFTPLNREWDEGLSPARLWKRLDYPKMSFDAIMLWDLLDHLDDDLAAQLVLRCHDLIKPAGKLMVIAKGIKSQVPKMRSYAVQEGFELVAREIPDSRLPLRLRQNREMLALMQPFIEMRIFMYRDGLREFMFHKNSNEPTVLDLDT
jgi:hypothetical protein